MKRTQVILLNVSLLLVTLTLAAQEGEAWRAWVADSGGRLVQIDSQGRELQQITLTQDNETLQQVVIAADDQLAASIITRGSSRIARLYLHDLHDDERTLFSGSAPSLDTSLHFDSDGHHLAYVAGESLHVVDTRRGESVTALETTLFSGDPEAVPEILHFGDGQIWFRVGDTVLRWDLDSGQVIESDLVPSTPSDVFVPTGERLFADEATVSVLDSLTGGRFPFYINTVAIPVADGLHFVQNGQRVLFHGRHNDDDLWLLLERDGQIVRPLRNIERQSLHGTVSGFIYLLRTAGRSEVIAFDVDTPFSDTSIWQAEGDWSILQAATGAESFGPFKPWRLLADPVSDPPLLVVDSTPTPLPAAPTLLNPGMEVYVITNGDVLYLRDEPGTSGTILQYLYDRDVVTLLEGPVAADGFTWWRIRTDDGTEGWAAEASGDVSTLLPETPEPPRITPTPTLQS